MESTSGPARRIDFYDDPDAPPPNVLVPSANVIVVNEAGQLLDPPQRQRQLGDPRWPMYLCESLVDTAIRETMRKPGSPRDHRPGRIYTDPKHVILYTSDGEARQEFSVVFTARRSVQHPTRPRDASVRVVDRTAVADLPMDRSMRLRIDHFLSGRPALHLG